MGNKFTAGHIAIAECDRCGFRFKLRQLKKLMIKDTLVNKKVCSSCWEPSHPQLKLGEYPVEDPQAVREPRPDLSYYQSGVTGLQINQNAPTTSPLNDGIAAEGSRIIQWGWSPIGGASANDAGLTPNFLTSVGVVGNVTVTVT